MSIKTIHIADSSSINFTKRVRLIEFRSSLRGEENVSVKSEDLSAGYVDSNDNIYNYYVEYRNDGQPSVTPNVFIVHKFYNWNVTSLDVVFNNSSGMMLTFEEYE